MGINYFRNTHQLYNCLPSRNELQDKLKVARPQNLKQLPREVKIFQNNLSEQLQALLEKESEKVSQYLKVRFWC